MEELKITDNGETTVQIATVGQVIGSDRDGNPVAQNFTQNSFANIAANLSGEILVDKDHASLKPGVDKDSEAMGWLSDVKANEKGLFGKIKWTELGRKLIESRAFRFLSPVFRLNTNTKEPEQLVNVAITNMPSQQAIKPIINSMLDMGQLIVTPPVVEEVTDEEKEEDFNENSNEGKIKMELSKEELAEMIKAMVETCLAAKTEEVKEEVKEEEVVENTCEEVKEEVANVEETEETEEEVKTEEKKEVIQAEALNSAPTLAVSIAEVSDYEKALDASLQKNGGHFTRI